MTGFKTHPTKVNKIALKELVTEMEKEHDADKEDSIIQDIANKYGITFSDLETDLVNYELGRTTL